MQRIRDHYANLGLRRGWDYDRFVRLCRLISCTPQELAAMVGMSGWSLNQARQKRFTCTQSILLQTIEQVYMAAKRGLQYPPLIPLDIFDSTERPPHHD